MAETIQSVNPFSSAAIASTRPNTINFSRLTSAQKELDLQAAMWCYTGNSSFTMFQASYAKEFLRALNSAYKPPSRNTLSTTLLDSGYSSLKKRVDDMIAAMPNINVITNESSNVKGARLRNISIHPSVVPCGTSQKISKGNR